jgi:hypothetical protein
MSVHSHSKCTAVFVAEPTADGRNVHARFNARRREQVPKVVMREQRIAQASGGGGQTLLGAVDLADEIVGLCFRSSR